MKKGKEEIEVRMREENSGAADNTVTALDRLRRRMGGVKGREGNTRGLARH